MSRLRIHRSSWRRGFADGIAAVGVDLGWSKAAIYRAGKRVGIEHGEMRDAVYRQLECAEVEGREDAS